MKKVGNMKFNDMTLDELKEDFKQILDKYSTEELVKSLEKYKKVDSMYVIEVYKDDEFIGYANGNWDWDDADYEKYPYTIPDMDFNRLPDWTKEQAKKECKELKDTFLMYDFVIKEIN